MMKSNIIVIVMILVTGWMLFQPSVTGSGQVSDTARHPDIDNLKERGKHLDQVQEAKTEQLAEAVQQNQTIVAKPVMRRAIRNKKTAEPVIAPVSSIVIRTDSAVYQVPAECYAGVVIVDGQDIANALLTSELEICPESVKAIAPIRKTLWQRIKTFFSKPFN